MYTVHVKVIAETDGELHLSNLPIQKGDAIEAIVIVPSGMNSQQRRQRRDNFLKHVASVEFCSAGPYPTREELHERD